MSKLLLQLVLLVLMLAGSRVALGQPRDAPSVGGGPTELLQQLGDYPHAALAAFSEQRVIDHVLGLGALKKVRGVWQFKDSERLSGNLIRYTWQIVDGFSSFEVMQELSGKLRQAEGVALLFHCDGRACGQSAQWANRVFRQRILYGREDLQRYAVYRIGGTLEYRMAIYSAARTADRQYLHVDLLVVDGID